MGTIFGTLLPPAGDARRSQLLEVSEGQDFIYLYYLTQK